MVNFKLGEEIIIIIKSSNIFGNVWTDVGTSSEIQEFQVSSAEFGSKITSLYIVRMSACQLD